MESNKEKTVKGKKKWITWRSWHKWVGVFFSVFIILFCLSGIVMNHRRFFARYDISRSILPECYHIDDWNQSIVQGTLDICGTRFGAHNDDILAFGQTGIWLTDSHFSRWSDFNNGIAEGIDNRKISNVVMSHDGNLWCAALYDVYRYDLGNHKWKQVSLPGNDERISDIALRGKDTLVVATRSSLYEACGPDYIFVERPLAVPEGFEDKTTLFKMTWELHSGNLFGLPGKLIVDAVALVIIFLCVSGIVFFVLSYSVRRNGKKVKTVPAENAQSLRERMKRQGKCMKWNLQWHNKLGKWLIVFTLILSVTGMCLRPPLMIPLVMTDVKPLPGTTLSNDNVFHDKLRGIRWDDNIQRWLLATNMGIYALETDLTNAIPVRIDSAPTISPMGLNVFCRNPQAQEEWLIGSFSGLFSWNPVTGSVKDWFTGEAPKRSSGYPVAGHAVTGWTEDLAITNGRPVVFEYSASPSENLPETPEILKSQPMSLWNAALELHVGRCYEPFLGSVLSVLFVFISGLLLTLILVSGLVLRK